MVGGGGCERCDQVRDQYWRDSTGDTVDEGAWRGVTSAWEKITDERAGMIIMHQDAQLARQAQMCAGVLNRLPCTIQLGLFVRQAALSPLALRALTSLTGCP